MMYESKGIEINPCNKLQLNMKKLLRISYNYCVVGIFDNIQECKVQTSARRHVRAKPTHNNQTDEIIRTPNMCVLRLIKT